MNKTWFRRMIWSYLPIFLIIFTVIFFVFFQTLIEQNKKNAVEANKIFAGQLMQSIDISLKTIDQSIINEILKNKLILQFFEEIDDHNVYLNYQVAKRLQELKQEMPMIDSIYLVRLHDQFIYSGNVFHQVEEFGDHVFVQELERNSHQSQWTNLRQYREFSDQDYKNVISLVREAPISNGTKGFLVVNISTATFQAKMNGMYNVKNAFVSLKDRNGNVLLTNQDLSSGNEKPLSSVISEYTEWNMESGLNNGMLLGIVSTFSSIWFGLGLLVFISGIVSIVYVTRKNYKPIREIISRIDAYVFKQRDSLKSIESDEFTFIHSAIDNFIEKSELFEKKFEEIAHFKRKNIFNELITGKCKSVPNEDDIGMKVPAHCNRQQVMIIEIDYYRESFSLYQEHDQYLFKFVISSVVNEIMNNHSFAIRSEWTSNHQLTSIVFLPDPISDMTPTCEKIIEWVKHNLNFTVTIGIGGPVESLLHISHSNNQAYLSLKYKPVLGNNRIILYGRTPNLSNKESHKSLRLIHDAVDSYRLIADDWEEKFAAIFNEIRLYFKTKDEIIDLLTYFIYNLDLQMSQTTKEYLEIWKNEVLPHLHESVKYFETTEQIQHRLFLVLHTFSDRIAALRQERNYHQLLKEVRKYMEEHFYNPDLSLDYLSERFQLNAKYLSQLFKEQFGENFLDFLTMVRVEHAKHMLLNTNSSIQEIGDKVGYTNAVTFRRVFKRMEGISPVDFRNLNTKRRTSGGGPD